MEKTRLLYSIIDKLREVPLQNWKEIHISSSGDQKDFVMTSGSFTYRIKHRNVHDNRPHYLNGNNITPYTIEVEEAENPKPIITFNDEIKYRTQNVEEFIGNHIEELFLHIDESKKAFENGALSRLEREYSKLEREVFK